MNVRMKLSLFNNSSVSVVSSKIASVATALMMVVSIGAPAVTAFPSDLFAAEAGFNSPTAKDGAHDDWSNADNAFSSNNSYSTESTEGDDQSFENFGFSIPTGSTINGIEMTVEGFHTDSFGCQIQPRMWSESDNGHSDRRNQFDPPPYF